MLNPFRSEAEAFRFLLLAVAAFAAIAVASILGGAWAGVPVWLALTAAAVTYYVRQSRGGGPEKTVPRSGPVDEHRVLVVANETVAGRALRERIRNATEGRGAKVLVVAPALTSPLRHWVSDIDPGREEAQQRLDESLGRLTALGIDARGEIGDSDPLQAIEDALRTFGANEIIISTHPLGRSNWLEKGVVSGARERFEVPITHVVVDLEAERSTSAS